MASRICMIAYWVIESKYLLLVKTNFLPLPLNFATNWSSKRSYSNMEQSCVHCFLYPFPQWLIICALFFYGLFSLTAAVSIRTSSPGLDAQLRRAVISFSGTAGLSVKHIALFFSGVLDQALTWHFLKTKPKQIRVRIIPSASYYFENFWEKTLPC